MLEKINCSDDVKKLNDAQVTELAEEIREFLVKNVTETGGHLASNLGVVELTIAIHRVFNPPYDKLLFDVGHQCYVHKILTGRKEEFSHLRGEGGISGFPKPSESEYDAFGTGHSSTAPSAGLGFANASKISGSDSYTVVVLGDGAATGGLIYEALNNCRKDLNYIVILNENEMSISKNVGNISGLISKMRSSLGYFSFKDGLSEMVEHIPLMGKPILKFMRKCKKLMKMYFYHFSFIEEMGLKYYGPIDGNDLKKTELLLERAKKTGGSALIHLRTVKGKGYAPAQENPEKFHAVSPSKAEKIPGENFSLKAGETLTHLGKKNDRLCVITAAMSEGTGVAEFFREYPHRSFDVGIAEGHAVTFAAGLASGGCIPVFAVYSSFLQRAYDNILHDASLQGLHMVLLIDRAGLANEDGATHHGIWDVAFLSHMSNVSLFAPLSAKSEALYIEEAVNSKGICAVRYPKGNDNAMMYSSLCHRTGHLLLSASPEEIKDCDCLVVTYGRITIQAIEAVERASDKGIKTAIVVCEKLMPYAEVEEELSLVISQSAKKVVFVEEGIKHGGFAVNMVNELLSRKAFDINAVRILAIEEPPSHGDLNKLYDKCKISAEHIFRAICD